LRGLLTNLFSGRDFAKTLIEKSPGVLRILDMHKIAKINMREVVRLGQECDHQVFTCPQATGMRIGTVLQSISTLVLGLSIGLFFEWRLGLVALAFAPFMMISMFLMRRMMVGENEKNKKGTTGIEEASRVSVSHLLFLI